MTTRFDELAATIRARIDGCRDTGDAQVLFAESVVSEANGLIDAATALDPDQPSPAEQERMDRARALLGTLFLLRFNKKPGDLTDLAHVLAFNWPVADTPADVPPDPLRVLFPGPDADVTSQIGAAVALFQHGSADADRIILRVAVTLFDTVAAGTSPRDREFPLRVGCVVAANLAIHGTTGDLRAVDRAIEVSERFLTGLSPKHPDRPWFLAAVTIARVARLRDGGLADLPDAIETGELALALRERRFRSLSRKQRRRGAPFLQMLADLAYSFQLSPLRTRLEADLGYAYEVRAGLARVPAVDRFAGTVDDFLAYFDRTGDIDDLRAAVAAVKRFQYGAAGRQLGGVLLTLAAHLPESRHLAPSTPWPGPDRGGFLKRLWLAEFAPLVSADSDADDEVVNAVIEFGEYVLAGPGVYIILDETLIGLPNADDPATDRTLVRLGDVYAYRFSRFGEKSDIDRAVALVELVGSLDDANELGMVAWAYKQRFTVSRSKADLDTAVSLYEKALRTTSRDPTERTWLTHELADAYRATAKVSPGDREEFLQRGAELSERLLADASADDPMRALWLNALGDTHYQRYGDSQDPEDLERAIDFYRQAAAVKDEPFFSNKLGIACHSRFKLTGDLADLRLAISSYLGMLAWPAPDDALRLMNVANYCMAYRDLFDAAPDEVDADDLDTLAEVCTAPGRGNPISKVMACHAVGSLAMAMNQPHTAVHVLDHAIDLVRSAAWREIDWPDQEAYLGGIPGLASESIAAHLANGDPVGAVEAAERGRALILGSELDIRADLAHLATAQPALAEQLGEVRDRLNTPMLFDLVGAMHDAVGRNNRNHLWTEHDRIIEQVRRLPGFADFLRPPSLAELRPATEGGAVVLVNASAHRCDAVIVTCDADPVPIPLPQLTIEDVETNVAAILDATSTTSLTRTLRAQRVLPGILASLWESTVEPIVSVLSQGDREPRVWWLPIGALGQLPLHAAGVAGQPGALDLIVSSYIPTLRALQHARHRARPTVRKQLTVALEHKPGLPRLPGTAKEAAALHAQHPDHPLLANADATATNVQAALANCTWAHFACHASTDSNTSARAVLHLHGSELPVEAISRMHLDTAELAYLSACSTAARGRYADEPTNLASAFHLAGFRHVVASLWPLTDTVAADAAQIFYQALGDTPTADDTAHAARATARELRTRHPHRPDLWAALIHSGP